MTVPGFVAPFEPVPTVRPAPFAGHVDAATEADIAACADIAVATRGGKPSQWQRLIGTGMQGERGLTVVAREGRQVVGYASAHYLEPPDGDPAPAGYYLTGVTVAPPQRRRGIAHHLIAGRLGWIAQRANDAWYFANAHNLASIAAHQQFGFVEVTRGPLLCGQNFEGGTGILFTAPTPAQLSETAPTDPTSHPRPSR